MSRACNSFSKLQVFIPSTCDHEVLQTDYEIRVLYDACFKLCTLQNRSENLQSRAALEFQSLRVLFRVCVLY
jgi:hypothetical protein